MPAIPCSTSPGNPASGEFSAAGVPLLAPAPEGRCAAGRDCWAICCSIPSSFRDADGSVVTVDAGQSDLFARTVQQRLATSLFVGAAAAAAAGGAGRCMC